MLGALTSADADAGIDPAASLRYLAVLTGYACDLVRRGRMLPQLISEPDGWAARWRNCLSTGWPDGCCN